MIIFWSRQHELQYSPILGSFSADDINIKLTQHCPTLHSGDLLVVMGGANLKVMQAEGLLPKGRTINYLREQVFSVVGSSSKMMVTYDLNVETFDYSSFVKLQTDLNLVKRYWDTGELFPKLGKYEYVGDYAVLPYLINKLYNELQGPVRTALDLETVGLFPYHKNKFIVSISVTFEEGRSYVIRFKGVHDQPTRDSALWDQIRWLLNDDRVSLVGANLKFDLGWIRVKWGILCTNFKMDTTLVGSMLDENRSNSLNTHTKIYSPELGGYDDEFNQTVDKSRMDKVPKKQLLPYAGGDTDACLRVANKMAKQLATSKSQVRFYTKLLHPAARAFEDMEHTGVVVDVPYFNNLSQKLFKEMGKWDAKARKIMPNHILAKYDDDFALSRPVIIKDYMFTHHKGLKLKPKMLTDKTKEPSTAFDHLKMFDQDPDAKEFVRILKAWNSASKTESTFVTGFLNHLREDGRLHPTAILYRGDYAGDDKDSGTVCVATGTLILTEKGYVPVEQVVVGDKVLTHKGVWRRTLELIDNGKALIKKVTLCNGLSIMVTRNHKFLTERGWVRADGLQLTDQIYHYGEEELWKVIPEALRYEVSTWGRVRFRSYTSNKYYTPVDKRILTQTSAGTWGHREVDVYVGDGTKKALKVHRLVAQAFLPNHEGHTQVLHIDSVPGNNTVWNLKWGDDAENKKDAMTIGALDKTEHWQAKLTWAAVDYIRRQPKQRGLAVLMADKFGVSRELVRDVLANKRWVVRGYHEPVQDFALCGVASLEDYVGAQTWGLSVEDHHSHITNGIVTHNTGRLAFKGPAMQTNPKHTVWAPILRKGYPAPPGYVFVQWDYSQGELRVMACVANETTMIQAYKNGIDMHLKTGAELNGYTLKEATKMFNSDDPALKAKAGKIRQGGKAGNFGLIYGISPEGYVIYAQSTYEVIITLAEASFQQEAFFDLYPGVVDYHNEYKAMAHAGRFVQSPLGRVRHLPLINSSNFGVRNQAQRQAINSPIQSTLSDMTCLAFAEFKKKHGYNQECLFCLMTHDSLGAYVLEDRVDYWIPEVKEIMENLPLTEYFGWKPQLEFVVDAEMGETLADLKPY